MIKEAIEYIVKQTKPPRIQVDKPTNEQETIDLVSNEYQEFSPKGNQRIVTGSLSEFKRILKISKGGLYYIQDAFNVIGSHEIGRFTVPFLSAEIKQKESIIGSFYYLESFLIMLRSNFSYEKNLIELLSIISNLVSENGITQTDDGISQKISVKKGVTSVSAKIIPPAIELSSFFSFHEIGEIKRPFFIRLKQGSSQETQAGLFECPSDWEHKAIVKIQEYLEK